jgi:hypothetical protein
VQTRVIRSPHSCRVQAGSNNSVNQVRAHQQEWLVTCSAAPLHAALCVHSPRHEACMDKRASCHALHPGSMHAPPHCRPSCRRRFTRQLRTP